MDNSSCESVEQCVDKVRGQVDLVNDMINFIDKHDESIDADGPLGKTIGDFQDSVDDFDTEDCIELNPGSALVCSIDILGMGLQLSTMASQLPNEKSGGEASVDPVIMNEAVVVPAVEHQEFTGSGDDFVDVTIDGAALIYFECTGCSGNVVVRSDGDESLLVNAIGSYAGTHLINIYDGTSTSSFEIDADADWKLVVADLSELPDGKSNINGNGDAVIAFASDSGRAKISYEGEGNFVVIGYGGDRADLAVNEIGDYSGTVRLDSGLVQVNAEGAWTIEAS